MQRIEFNDQNLNQLEICDITKNYRDIKSKLHIRVYPTGKKSFWMKISSSNSKKVLGEYPDLSIEEARLKVQENYNAQTFLNLLEKIKQYEKDTLLYSKDKIEGRWYVLSIKCELLKSILKLDPFCKDLNLKLCHLLKSIEETRGPSASRKTYKKLCELLKAAVDAKLTYTPISIRSISKHIPKAGKRDTYIYKPEDMKAFLRIISSSYEYQIFLVALLTCARIGDVIDMRLDDIDLLRKAWVFKPQKQMENNKEDVHVPLTTKVIEIINQRKSVARNNYLFATSYLAVRDLWVKLRKIFPDGIKDLNIHDLRRTHVHWLGSKDFLIVQHSLSHKVSGQTGVYISNAATFNERLKLITNMENKIFSLLSIKDSDGK